MYINSKTTTSMNRLLNFNFPGNIDLRIVSIPGNIDLRRVSIPVLNNVEKDNHGYIHLLTKALIWYL
jgi:hypothetical protein